MVRRNPAFRIATGGLTIAVMLCLVAAVSLLSSTPAVNVSRLPSSESIRLLPIQVAAAGEVGRLLHDHPRKPVPDPLEQTPEADVSETPSVTATLEDDQPGPWQPRPVNDEPQFIELPPPPVSDPVQWAGNSSINDSRAPVLMTNLESEISMLKGQVSELARTQLEGQLAEIRHAEQLLSTHQTCRMIETLQLEVDELKSDRQALTESRLLSLEQGEPVAGSLPSTVSENGASSEIPTEGDNAPLIASESSALESRSSTDRVRCQPTQDVAGRFDVDVNEATLRELMAKLGPVAGWNFVSGPEVQGTVTCRWQGVDLKEALTQLLRAHGWQVRVDGEFVLIEPLPHVVLQSSESSASSADGDHASGPVTLELETDSSGLVPPASDSELSTPAQSPAGTDTARPSPKRTPEPDRTGHVPVLNRSFSHPPPGTGRIVMKDSSEVMAMVTRSDSPQAESLLRVEIETTILQIQHVPGSPRGEFRQALTVTDVGLCSPCGPFHTGPVVGTGHSRQGWLNGGDGTSCAVCPQSPEWITSKLQQFSAASVISTSRVEVLNQQLAEIGLTEQQGFRRVIVRSEAPNESTELSEGSVQLSLRPTVLKEGSIRLEIRPSGTSSNGQNSSRPAESGASLLIPSGRCAVLGGLYFESEPQAELGGQTEIHSPIATETHSHKGTYEVVVLIRTQIVRGSILPRWMRWPPQKSRLPCRHPSGEGLPRVVE